MFLSIMGMYEYDNTLFDGLDIPTYIDPNNTTHVVDKTDVINSIMLECAELEVIYPAFDTMKLAIGVWSASNQETWQNMYKSQMIEYNPIWNVDADVKITRTNNASGENINAVQGFNTSSWANANKDNSTLHSGESVTERRTGNIGVTSSEKLLKEFREVAEFSIIKFITDSFKRRFCILVY